MRDGRVPIERFDELQDDLARQIKVNAERTAENQRLREALRDLTTEVGKLPENAHAAIQGRDLNRAYSRAVDVLETV